jgi:hypothetical protein
MEDGIEQNIHSLKIKNTKNIENIENNQFIYLFIKDNSDWEDYIIITNKNKAIEYSNNNNCRVEIFTENKEGNYEPTFCYYKNGEYNINS